MCITSSLGWFSAGLAQCLHSQELAQGEDPGLQLKGESSVTTEQALGDSALLFCAQGSVEVTAGMLLPSPWGVLKGAHRHC